MTWVLLVVLLACSAAVSGSETALFGLSRQDLHTFATSSSRLRRTAALLLHHPHHLLLTVLITNTAVNIGIFAVSFLMAEDLGRSSPLLASLAGVGALVAVILFGEILPKSIALSHPRRLAPLVAPGIQALQFVLTPVRWLLAVLLVEPATRLLLPPAARVPAVSTEELRDIIDSSAGHQVLNSVESDMLQAVVGLADVNVRSVLVPRVDMIAVSLGDEREAIRDRFEQSGKTKLPVFDRDLDDVRGLLYARDFHLNPERSVEQLLRPVAFVPEQANLIQVIRHFRLTHTQLAIVVDEYGGVAGLVTLEDVLEEIVGDLRGPAEEEQPLAQALDDNTYRLSGQLGVRDWASLFGITAVDADVDTLGGLITARLGRLPRVGDCVRTGNLTITVESLRGRRVGTLILHRMPAGTEVQA
ncbi:MAG: HlyC/CorC family transporter [Phycisphaerae bacterium]|nr:HlyC/CorC family transporter [Phycisphaerae bacterium]